MDSQKPDPNIENSAAPRKLDTALRSRPRLSLFSPEEKSRSTRRHRRRSNRLVEVRPACRPPGPATLLRCHSAIAKCEPTERFRQHCRWPRCRKLLADDCAVGGPAAGLDTQATGQGIASRLVRHPVATPATHSKPASANYRAKNSPRLTTHQRHAIDRRAGGHVHFPDAAISLPDMSESQNLLVRSE